MVNVMVHFSPASMVTLLQKMEMSFQGAILLQARRLTHNFEKYKRSKPYKSIVNGVKIAFYVGNPLRLRKCSPIWNE